MNIEQIKKDWEQECKKHGVKAKINTEAMHTSAIFDKRVMVVLGTSNGRNAIKLIPNLVSFVHKDMLDSFFMQLISHDKTYKLFTTFYEKLMQEQDNE